MNAIKLLKLEKIISEQPKYKRQPCINCEYKLICAGECDKTLKREEWVQNGRH